MSENVWLVHFTRDYGPDEVRVFASEQDALDTVERNADQYPDPPYEAVVE